MQVWRMRTGISITLKPADRRRLAALARDRNAPHKHVWRAEIVLLSADGVHDPDILFINGASVVGNLHRAALRQYLQLQVLERKDFRFQQRECGVGAPGRHRRFQARRASP